MSTGCECSVFEFKPSQWFYLLENDNAPKNAWDWRDNSQCYGPFDSETDALSHLDDNHANPGSYGVSPYVAAAAEDEVLAALVKTALPGRHGARRRW